MITRRLIMLTPLLLVPTGKVFPQDIDEEGKRLGDKGFKHKWLHAHYQKYMSTIICPCHNGECRPTKWGRDADGTILVWLDRRWERAASTTLIKDKRNIPDDFPPELLKYSAHACAYGVHPNVTVTCIWVMDAGV